MSYECDMNIDDEDNNPYPVQPTFRPKRRLKAARERAGLSIRQLGAKTGIDATTISKIENGTMQYKEAHVYALAASLNVNSLDIWEPENETVDNSFSSPPPAPVAELREDAAPFDPADAKGDATLMALLKSLPIEQFPYRVKSQALDKIGILPGDIIVFDISAEKSANKKNGDVIIASDARSGITKMLIRQFLKPSILVTNSSRDNIVMDIDRENVPIMGVFHALHRI